MSGFTVEPTPPPPHRPLRADHAMPKDSGRGRPGPHPLDRAVDPTHLADPVAGSTSLH